MTDSGFVHVFSPSRGRVGSLVLWQYEGHVVRATAQAKDYTFPEHEETTPERNERG